MNRSYLWDLCGDLDDIAFRMECSNRLVLIAHTAFIDGQSCPGKEDFEALYAIHLQQDALIDELRDSVKTLQAAGREPDTESDEAADVLRTLSEAYTAGLEGRPPRHAPAISYADEATREKMKIYGEAMNAMYQCGRLHAEQNSTG